jgi:hypothetical protein
MFDPNARSTEADKGLPLGPSAKDLKPWYSEKATTSRPDQEIEDERKCAVCCDITFLSLMTTLLWKRDTARKSMHDPLTSITHQLAFQSSKSGSSSHNSHRSQLSSSTGTSAVDARLTRESSE